MSTGPHPRRNRGITLAELATALVVLAVLTAIAVPTWKTHTLRVRRTDAIEALTALQAAQDGFFGRHARYADAAKLALAVPDGLGLADRSSQRHYRIELRTSDDGLGYLASAKPVSTDAQSADTRCSEFTIDHNGRRHAVDADGVDRSADCWQ
jgi:type IV pilus assembly protein PilE